VVALIGISRRISDAETFLMPLGYLCVFSEKSVFSDPLPIFQWLIFVFLLLTCLNVFLLAYINCTEGFHCDISICAYNVL
jgi:hypothetical protein